MATYRGEIMRGGGLMLCYRHKIPQGVVVLCVLLSTRDIHQYKLPSIYTRKCHQMFSMMPSK
jgi:hypothetical protein